MIDPIDWKDGRPPNAPGDPDQRRPERNGKTSRYLLRFSDNGCNYLEILHLIRSSPAILELKA